jgi:hydroxymethylpyrimidine pyrophosphatase-like HAD family hydrolase
MRYVALAAGYDGTLARDGRCDEQCVEALRALAATGRKLILVTCRELRELLEIFPEARVFDYLVAECGAVMHRPATRESAILAQAPSEILVQELRRRDIAPLVVGSSTVTTHRAHEHEVRDAIGRLRLESQLISNGDAIIILPAGVNKASGIRAVLRELGLSPHNLAAIGSSENDVALMSVAEYAVAVENADPGPKRIADKITQGSHCDGFVEFARELMSDDLAHAPARHKLVLGMRGDVEISIEACKEAVLVCGPPDSGKAAVCTGLLQQLLRHKYQCCVIGTDVDGTYALLPGISVFGAAHEIPRLTDILDALEHPAKSIAINLAALPMETRSVFVDALLLQLQALHDRVGRPHAILIDQAHCFLAGNAGAHPTPRLSDVTMVYSTSEPAQLPPRLAASVQVVIALGSSSQEIKELCKLTGNDVPAASQLSVPRGQALLWRRARDVSAIQLHEPGEPVPDESKRSSQAELST